MPRSRELSDELNKYIYDHYVFAHESERAIMRSINENPKLLSHFGELAPADVHYHTAKIKVQLENTLDVDAIDKYTAEYIRFYNSIESEIEDVEEIIKLIDKEKEKETWIKLKRLKKELMETKLRALQDHELPLVIRKLKRERDVRNKTIKVLEPGLITDIPIEVQIINSPTYEEIEEKELTNSTEPVELKDK